MKNTKISMDEMLNDNLSNVKGGINQRSIAKYECSCSGEGFSQGAYFDV